MEATCPHCAKQFDVLLTADIPNSQEFVLEATSESELLAGKTVGGLIENGAELLREVAKGMGESVAVFVKSVVVLPHKVAVTMLVAKQVSRKVKPRKDAR